MTSSSNLFCSASMASNSNRYSDNLTIWSHITSNLLEQWITESNSDSKLIIIDSRESTDYCSTHIKNSINIPASKIVFQQLKSDKISINELLIKYSNKDLISNNKDELNIVVYDQKSEHTNQLDLESSFTILLLRKLAQKFKSVSFLIEGFTNFSRMYPYLCEGMTESSCFPRLYPVIPVHLDQSSNTKTMDSFGKPKHLRLNHSLSTYLIELNSSSNSTVSSASSLVSDTEPKFQINYLVSPSEDKQPINEPTKILDFMYLGSQENALCQQTLDRLGITFVLNVSVTCPKAEFILDGNFLRISINDCHSAKISNYFEVAFKFIEKCRRANKKVLIHCLAGISRSPTLAIAYLMKHMNMKLDEAFKFVKDRRFTISPNFNFLGQLYEYEKQLINNGQLKDTKNEAPEPKQPNISQEQPILFASSRRRYVYDFMDKSFVLNKPDTRKVSNLQSPSNAFSKFNLNSPIVEKQSLAKSLTCNSIAEMAPTSQTSQTNGKGNVVMRRPTNLSLLDNSANRLKRPNSILLFPNDRKSEPVVLTRAMSNDSTSLSFSCCSNTCANVASTQAESNTKKLRLCEQNNQDENKSSILHSPLTNYTLWNIQLNNHSLSSDVKSSEFKRMFSSSENVREESKSRDESINEEEDCENDENSLANLLKASKSNSSSSSSNKNSLHGSTETMIEVL